MMKLYELMETKSDERGTYSAVKFDKSTVDSLQDYIKENDIPNPIAASKMHTTVLYSRKYCPDYKPQGEISPPWIGTPDGLEVWETKGKLRDEPTKRCLVLKFKCDKLSQRHKDLMKEHDATYDFPDYKPHITLSYDIGDMDEKELPDVSKFLSKIKIVSEYGEDLDLDWADKKAKKDE